MLMSRLIGVFGQVKQQNQMMIVQHRLQQQHLVAVAAQTVVSPKHGVPSLEIWMVNNRHHQTPVGVELEDNNNKVNAMIVVEVMVEIEIVIVMSDVEVMNRYVDQVMNQFDVVVVDRIEKTGIVTEENAVVVNEEWAIEMIIVVVDMVETIDVGAMIDEVVVLVVKIGAVEMTGEEAIDEVVKDSDAMIVSGMLIQRIGVDGDKMKIKIPTGELKDRQRMNRLDVEVDHHVRIDEMIGVNLLRRTKVRVEAIIYLFYFNFIFLLISKLCLTFM